MSTRIRNLPLLVAAFVFPILAQGCATTKPGLVPPPTSVASEAVSADRQRACVGPEIALRDTPIAWPGVDPPDSEVVTSVRVEGSSEAVRAMVRAVLQTRVGRPFTSSVTDDDVVTIHGLGAFDDVRAEYEPSAAGVQVVFYISDRPKVRAVYFTPDSDPPQRGEWQAPSPGDFYDPAALARAARILGSTWIGMGRLDARVQVRAVRVHDQVDLCLTAVPGPTWKVERVVFPGAHEVPEDELRAQLQTHKESGIIPGKPYRPDWIQESMPWLHARLYERGLIASEVRLPRLQRHVATHTLVGEIPIDEGPIFHIGTVKISGHLVGPRDEYLRAFGSHEGELFMRSRMVEAIERVRAHHRKAAGHEESIEPDTLLHPELRTVDITLQVGPEASSGKTPSS